jgi:hypothetical protein
MAGWLPTDLMNKICEMLDGKTMATFANTSIDGNRVAKYKERKQEMGLCRKIYRPKNPTPVNPVYITYLRPPNVLPKGEWIVRNCNGFDYLVYSEWVIDYGHFHDMLLDSTIDILQRTDVLAQLVGRPETNDFAIRGMFLSELLSEMDQSNLPLFYVLTKQPAEMFSNRPRILSRLLMLGNSEMFGVLLELNEDYFENQSYSLCYLLASLVGYNTRELLLKLLRLPHNMIEDRPLQLHRLLMYVEDVDILKVLLELPEDDWEDRSHSLHLLLAYGTCNNKPDLLALLLELPHSMIEDRPRALDRSTEL